MALEMLINLSNEMYQRGEWRL